MYVLYICIQLLYSIVYALYKILSYTFFIIQHIYSLNCRMTTIYLLMQFKFTKSIRALLQLISNKIQTNSAKIKLNAAR